MMQPNKEEDNEIPSSQSNKGVLVQSNEKREQKKIEVKKGEDGIPYYDIGSHKRVAIRNYKGKSFVDIREFYEKDGKFLPGKKGISLSIENWQKFRELINIIDSLILEDR